MKKYTILAAMAIAFSAVAQSEPVQLAVPAGSHHPVLSPDGSTLLFSTDNHTGLSAMNLADGSVRILDSEAGAGFQPIFSLDGKKVYYRSAAVTDGLMTRDVRAAAVDGSSAERIAAHSREDVDLAALAGGDYALAQYRSIKVVRNGAESTVSPLADSHSYLWASLSPDGKRLLFTEPFEGVFVADADGSNPRKVLAKGDFPAWASNNAIVAVVTHDDGYVVLDSSLVLVNIATGISRTLTSDDVKVGEATASANGTVVFTDLAGQMFIFNLNEQ